jgi:TonB family protein
MTVRVGVLTGRRATLIDVSYGTATNEACPSYKIRIEFRPMLISRNRLVLVALTIMCLPHKVHSADSAAIRGAAMLQQAHAIVEAALDQSLTQAGHLTVLTGPKPLEGSYTYAGSGSLWRDEVVVASYKEVRVRTGNEEKIQRPLDYEPLAIYAAFEAVRPIKLLQLLPDERVTRVKSEKVAKVPANCIEIEAKHIDRIVCVYDDRTLAALRSGTGLNYEYSDYSRFEKAQLPGRIRGMENGTPVFELQMSAAQALTAGADIRENVVHSTLTLGWCKGMVRPVADNKVQPHYPESARQSRTQGTVDLYGIIAADGRLTNLATVRSGGPALDKSSLDAISQWTYRPALCGTAPVSSETVISVHYSLSP